VKPFRDVTVTVDEPVVPADTVTTVGLAVTLKSWTVTATVADLVSPLATPWTVQVYVAATVALNVRGMLAVAEAALAGPVHPLRPAVAV